LRARDVLDGDVENAHTDGIVWGIVLACVEGDPVVLIARYRDRIHD